MARNLHANKESGHKFILLNFIFYLMSKIDLAEFKQELQKMVEKIIDEKFPKEYPQNVVTREEIKEIITEFRADSIRHYEEISKTWEEIKGIKTDIQKIWEELKRQREETTKIHQDMVKMNDSINTVLVDIKVLSNKMGPELEHLIFEILREGIALENIDPKKIEKIYLKDEEGTILEKGEITDIDVVLQNGNIYLIEVKATADNHDVRGLLEKKLLYEKIHKKEVSKLYLACLRINAKNFEYAVRKNVKVITGEIIIRDLS